MARARPPRKSITEFYHHPETKSGDLILIVCEGEKTEPTYFKGLSEHWKLHNARLEICGEECASDPKQIVEFALNRRNERARKSGRGGQPQYDQVWCVFDRDNHHHLAAALNQANDQGINVALSVPCFEIWYLLHFIYTTKPFRDAAEVIRDLNGHVARGYSKATPPLDELLARMADALQHAYRLSAHNTNTDSSNPYTDVHRLIEELKR